MSRYGNDKMTISQQRKVNASGNPAAIIAMAQGRMADALLAATPGGIEAQEAAGQSILVANFCTLPADGMERHRGALIKIGFQIGDAADDIFVRVTPPPGWSLRPAGGSYWSDIVDQNGRKRGSVFYKAAFYDRHANFRLNTRYCVTTEYIGDQPPCAIHYRVLDEMNDNAILFEAEPIPPSDKWEGELERKRREDCERWLAEHYPDCADVTAYWE